MTPSDQRYEPSSQDPLFILAMDQRSSFAKLFGLEGNADEVGLAKMRDAKLMIYEGLHQVAASGLEVGRVGVLVDEHLGSEVARRAKADGHVLAMPIEKSGTTLFELEYGKDYPEHLAAYDPDFFKVLVRYNPEEQARAILEDSEDRAKKSAEPSGGSEARAFALAEMRAVTNIQWITP
jgi:myo-inositol catabolism protein IolC